MLGTFCPRPPALFSPLSRSLFSLLSLLSSFSGAPLRSTLVSPRILCLLASFRSTNTWLVRFPSSPPLSPLFRFNWFSYWCSFDSGFDTPSLHKCIRFRFPGFLSFLRGPVHGWWLPTSDYLFSHLHCFFQTPHPFIHFIRQSFPGPPSGRPPEPASAVRSSPSTPPVSPFLIPFLHSCFVFHHCSDALSKYSCRLIIHDILNITLPSILHHIHFITAKHRSSPSFSPSVFPRNLAARSQIRHILPQPFAPLSPRTPIAHTGTFHAPTEIFRSPAPVLPLPHYSHRSSYFLIVHTGLLVLLHHFLFISSSD